VALAALSKNKFYRHTYPQILRLLILMVFLNLGVTVFLSYGVFFPKRTAYFAVMPKDREQRIIALDYPVVPRGEVIRWVSQAVISIYNYGFNNWKPRLERSAHYFTPGGYDQFRQALIQSGILNTIIEQKLQVTAVVTGEPVIVAEGILGGRYSWKVNMPVLLTYLTSGATSQRRIVVTILVARTPVVNSPRGYAIEQFLESA